jgi:hypothetical protein
MSTAQQSIAWAFASGFFSKRPDQLAHDRAAWNRGFRDAVTGICVAPADFFELDYNLGHVAGLKVSGRIA